MATPASTVIDRVVKNYRINSAQEVAQAAYSAGDTAITVGQDYLVGLNSLIETASGELMLCTDFVTATKVATVIRGWMGTTAATIANKEMLIVDPRVIRSDVIDWMNEALDDMYDTVFQTDSQQITYNESVIGYALDAAADDILAVTAKLHATTVEYRAVNDWEVMTNLPTADFASGSGIMIRTALPTSATINVVYTKPFTQIAAETDDLEAAVGLRPYMIQALYYYAMSRALVLEETERSQSGTAQSHQRAQDVPGFLALRTGEWYQARYRDKVKLAYRLQTREVKKIRTGGYGG